MHSASLIQDESPWAKAQELFLNPYELSSSQLSDLTARICSRGVDFADLYFQHVALESWILEEGILKTGHYSIDQGVGIRAVRDDKVALAYTDNISMASLRVAADTVRAIGRQGQSVRVPLSRLTTGHELYMTANPQDLVPDQDKVDLLRQVDQMVRQSLKSLTVKQLSVSMVMTYEVILIVRSDGVTAADVRPLIRLSMHAVVEKDGRVEEASAGGGGRYGSDYYDEARLNQYVGRLVHKLETNLVAEPAPAGIMTVVLGAGWPGVLLHEAVGHGLEGDFNRKGSSAFAGMLGQRIASELVTVVDDGTIPHLRGSLNVDDEGNKTQCTTLIEKGVFKAYMQDMMNAALMSSVSTGNGRRESYAHLTMPRMTNTYMLPGEHERDEIIASVEDGLYMADFGGGQVDITNGRFVFSASEAYRIEGGRITTPVKGATLIGQGAEVISQISMVGNDLTFDPGVGTCGKDGQSVPVTVGQPSLKIESITVGGTSI